MPKSASQIAYQVLTKVAMTEEEAARVAKALGVSSGIGGALTAALTYPKFFSERGISVGANVPATLLGVAASGGLSYGLMKLLAEAAPLDKFKAPWFAKSDEAMRNYYLGSGVGSGLGGAVSTRPAIAIPGMLAGTVGGGLLGKALPLSENS